MPAASTEKRSAPSKFSKAMKTSQMRPEVLLDVSQDRSFKIALGVTSLLIGLVIRAMMAPEHVPYQSWEERLAYLNDLPSHASYKEKLDMTPGLLAEECNGTQWYTERVCAERAEVECSQTIVSKVAPLNWAGVTDTKLDVSNRQNLDTVFQHIDRINGNRPWGRLLDAGTGIASMYWMSGLQTEGWTAVTNDHGMKKVTLQSMTEPARPQDRFILGTWADPTLEEGELYDTILAHYLVGSVEGYEPYTQDLFWERLSKHLAPGGRMYVVGWEPFEMRLKPGVATDAKHILMDAVYMTGTCAYAESTRPFREYPLDWYLRTLTEADFKVVDLASFQVVYQGGWPNKEGFICRQALPVIKDEAMREGMTKWVQAIEYSARTNPALQMGEPMGMDFLLVVEKN